MRKDLFFQQALRSAGCPLRRVCASASGLFIETLAQTRRRGHPADLQCLLEKEILAHLFHRLEIVLALAQQAQVGAHQVDVGDAVAQGDGLEPLPQATMAVDDRSRHCHAGLAVAGPIINRHSGLRKRLKSIPLRHGIPHIDLVRTYLGLLCQGKNDFEAVEEVRKDLFFQQALEIGRVPSSARLRQRFDEQADLQCLLEKEILAHLFHRLEIVLALAQQPR